MRIEVQGRSPWIQTRWIAQVYARKLLTFICDCLISDEDLATTVRVLQEAAEDKDAKVRTTVVCLTMSSHLFKHFWTLGFSAI